MDNTQDKLWMQQALVLAVKAEQSGEIPVGALLVHNGKIIGSGYNQPITNHDPSAHAEIQTLRNAGLRLRNYRFPNTTLYCTLEPCSMCAGAIIHARIAKVIYGAADPKGGACGSVFNLLPSDTKFNHHTECYGGVLAQDCGALLQKFFRRRRLDAKTSMKKVPTPHNTSLPLAALLFDVDGTLADTERDGHRAAFNLAFAKMELDWCWSVELYGQLLDVTGGEERIHHFITNFKPPIPELPNIPAFIKQLHQAKTRIYNEILHNQGIPLRPGVLRLLQQAKAAGLKLAIVTTTSLENVTSLLTVNIGAFALSWFDCIAAGTMVTAKKPAPDIYLYALNQLGVPAAACIAIEDSALGLQAARSAGIKTVIATVTDYTREQDFTTATLVLENLGEPTAPCQMLSGKHEIHGCVDITLLSQLHEQTY